MPAALSWMLPCRIWSHRSKRAAKEVQSRPVNVWKVDVVEGEERELKLIGLRVDEALDLLEPFLNHASLAGCARCASFTVSGRDGLRDAVRECLARHPLVDEFRAG